MSEPITPPITPWKGYIRAMVIGPSKAGKSSFALGAPRVFFFDCDRALRHGVSKHLLSKTLNFTYIEPDSWQDVLVWTMKLLRGEKFKWQDGVEAPAETICIDTGDEAYNLTAMSVLTIMDTRAFSKSRVGDNILSSREHRELQTQQDFGLSRERFRRWIREIVKFPGHVILNMHEEFTKDELKGTITGGATIPGKLRSDLPGYFDMYLRVVPGLGEQPPRINTKSDGVFNLGDRTGTLAAVEECNFEKILAKVRGGTQT